LKEETLEKDKARRDKHAIVMIKSSKKSTALIETNAMEKRRVVMKPYKSDAF